MRAAAAGGWVVLAGVTAGQGPPVSKRCCRARSGMPKTCPTSQASSGSFSACEKLPDDAWLVGRGWDQALWEGGEFRRARDLDRVFSDRPVWLVRVDCHVGWSNSAAMEKVAREHSGSWQADGGEILRDGVGPT